MTTTAELTKEKEVAVISLYGSSPHHYNPYTIMWHALTVGYFYKVTL